jgi:hypothetical protein
LAAAHDKPSFPKVQLAEQTGWSPEELSAAVGILRGRQQVVLDDAALGSGNYGFTSIMLPS